MRQLNRRSFLAGVAAGTAAIAASRSTSAQQSLGTEYPAANEMQVTGAALAEPAFRPLPLGSITPGGWLRRQLRIQANGLSGHLDEFWPDVGQSQWFGGQAEGWERAPYWLDGVIPLAWLLDDSALKDRINRYIEYIVAHQRDDGWYGPYPVDAGTRRYDLWAILLANKVLVQYHDATGDEKVLQAVTKSLAALHQGLDHTPLYNWGRYRWFEGLTAVFYAYERTGDRWLLDLGRKLQAQGFDYQEYYRGEDITVPTPRRGVWKWGNGGESMRSGLAIGRRQGGSCICSADDLHARPLPWAGDGYVHRR
jgi:hypothetical protein